MEIEDVIFLKKLLGNCSASLGSELSHPISYRKPNPKSISSTANFLGNQTFEFASAKREGSAVSKKEDERDRSSRNR
jgi:hypothetical protein